MNTRVQQTMDTVLKRFKSGTIPEAVAYSMFPFPNVPSARWSMLNRTLMFIHGTMDARGLYQWNRVNRYVRKGTKAIYIIVPYIKMIEDGGTDKQMLVGFGSKPVFKVEDTRGKSLDYEDVKVPPFPLIERAEAWGISVKAVPGNYQYYGYYLSSRREIALATKEECVFFHELAHCADDILNDGLRPGQDPIQEIVAELAGHCLCRLVGKSGDRYIGNSYRYIERYASKIRMTPHQACLKVFSKVERVLKLILNGDHRGQDNLYRAVA